jgi:NAD(P)-dependent dehydrogenase (short-subunit alcohol dehydrogenase family)
MEKTTPNVLVTGASRGIGKSIFDLISARGCNVVGHASTDAGDLIGADFGSDDGPQSLWQTALNRLSGRIDVVINNAGIFEPNPLSEPADAWQTNWNATMQTNLTASAMLCRFAVLHWQQSGISGRIVNIASRAAYRGDSPDHWHYAASKAGMVAMTKTIARAYAHQDILAFAICPGFTMTGMAQDYLASRGGDKLLADIPLGKVASPEEIASIAAFCALDAPPSMTGAVLDANGASYVR